MSQVFLNTTADKVLRTLQLVQLECVKEVDRICRKHDIKYTLGGGTCLGRYRHGGFIPWDDDIDIDMFASEYDKFMQVAPSEIDSTKFKLISKFTTDGHYRTIARIEAVGTKLSMPRWDKDDVSVGIFIDIFRIVYLPDDEINRERVKNQLYLLRSVETYVMTHQFPRCLSERDRVKVRRMAKTQSIEDIMNQEEDIISRYCMQPSNWKYADSLIACNYNGYIISDEEIADCEFEGIKVMDRKYPETFLEGLYGSDYYEWLPPTQRISHHKWTKIDFGHYSNLLNLPDNYSDYITANYNEEKLCRMHELSLEIASYFDELCANEKLHYCVIGYDAIMLALGKLDLADLWREPLSVAMPRADYEKLLSLNSLDSKYFIQCKNTDKNYFYQHARLQLKYTDLWDNRLPLAVRDVIHPGFYIRIIPVDNISPKTSAKTIDQLNDLTYLKWTKPSLNHFIDTKGKRKLKLVINSLVSVEKRWQSAYDAMTSGNSNPSEMRQLSIDNDRRSCRFDKTILENVQRCDYMGHKLYFPAKLDDFMNSELANKIELYSTIKKAPANRCDFVNILISEVPRANSRCTMSYYDNPDYQLSAIRYDEKEDRFISNEEL